MAVDGVRIDPLDDEHDPEVRSMLVDLALDEQEHFEHPRETRLEVEARLRAAPSFVGENRILVARDAGGRAVGLCWVVLFDPGTGLEAEIAELYVQPALRRKGIAAALLRKAVELMRAGGVTFASVWTRTDNPAAAAVYRAAGFRPTEQLVLTWLPTSPSDGADVSQP
jgi:ribosomal protein S18 acetylase RimI-like enzyme